MKPPLTEREQLIFSWVERAMKSKDPDEYVRTVGSIHQTLDTSGDGILIPACYVDAVTGMLASERA